jgi:3-hydroxybutyryl-CoA dehydrogenase
MTEARPVIGIVGAGTMGRGIAQLFVQSGYPTLLHDAVPGAAEAGVAQIREAIARAVAKGRLPETAVATAENALVVVETLADLAPAQVIVEAIVEDLDAKRSLFRALEDSVGEPTILATNTSSLSISAIAAGCKTPARVAGFHFFNPAPVMRLVEIVRGLRTAPQTIEALSALAHAVGHESVIVADVPGFVVNHAGRALTTEGLRLLQEGVADIHTLDAIAREAVGLPLGPFELMDLIGLDVVAAVMASLYAQHFHEPRFRPTPALSVRVAAGLLGRKSGEGFYRYADGRAVVPPEEPAPVAPHRPIWVSPKETHLRDAVAALLAETGAALVEKPTADAVLVVTPYGMDATEECVRQGLAPERTVAVDAFFGLARRMTLAGTPATDPGAIRLVQAAFERAARKVSVIQDSPGLVAPRIAAQIVNTAAEIAQQHIAAPADIDRASIRALGYPVGPLALGDRLGAATVLRILEELQTLTGDPRYRPSPWLRRRARLGLSLLAVEC